MKIYDINIYILNNDISLYNMLNTYDKNKYTIFLYYENYDHFQLIGYYKNHKMISHFQHSDIPIELDRLINK